MNGGVLNGEVDVLCVFFCVCDDVVLCFDVVMVLCSGMLLFLLFVLL